MREDKEVELIGVPFDMGAGILGARLAPEAVDLRGLFLSLRSWDIWLIVLILN